jgi:hypothetical protein
MAAPNLKNPTIITGKTAVGIASTVLGSVLDNTAGSNKVLKINSIRTANIISNQVTVDLSFYRSSTHTYMQKDSAVSSTNSLIILSKDEYMYLEEGDSIYLKSNTSSSINYTIHYEEIS